ncbi:hypothetical protein Sfulv_00450 [Streptomyces fulvorobeus]|uniref:Uncharacterized protein n=1 Tax=Streptomyces fulvorobeus TaxID=284028 RepID=A0A7J0BZU3_9ACTN|nr:hypothetical protein Sfulv_00450 [Streptomyces fulvorobeus]
MVSEALRLVLPHPDAGRSNTVCGRSCAAVDPGPSQVSQWAALLRAAEGGSPPEVYIPPSRACDLAWYRWVVGHQAAFLEWSLLRAVLIREGPESADEIVQLLDLYSTLLLYAGSCPPELYQQAIRPRMARAHPAFSGEWAPDHEGLPQLLKRAADVGPPTVAGAVRRSHRVHVAVAEHLVPGGVSLLQQAGRSAGGPPSSQERALYDRFFLVSRGPVCTHALDVQLLHRLLRILVDVEGSGLYYGGPPVSAAAGGFNEIAELEQTVLTRLRAQGTKLAASMQDKPHQ